MGLAHSACQIVRFLFFRHLVGVTKIVLGVHLGPLDFGPNSHNWFPSSPEVVNRQRRMHDQTFRLIQLGLLGLVLDNPAPWPEHLSCSEGALLLLI